MARIAVVGFGAWGTAIAAHAARLGHEVVAWAREAEVVDDVNARHRNTPFLPDVALPDTIRATTDATLAVKDAELVVLVPPSKHLRDVAKGIASGLAKDAIVVVASKGIEEHSLELMSQVLGEALSGVGPERVVYLSGPSFAKEVASGLPTDVVAASTAPAAAARVQELLHTPMFRVYTSADPVGVQIGGAVKNVIAIAAGACDGLGLGTNARAALIARGLAEITRLGVALGGDPLTFLGMAGVGDLILTCTGGLSRNRELGAKVAEGVDPKAYLATKRSVAEGYWTSAATYELAKRRGVDMPITEQVYHVLHEGRPLLEALKLLVTREFKEELLGIRAPSGMRAELVPLFALAHDVWWSWQPGVAELFRRIDPLAWEQCGANPVRLLREASPATLDRAAADRDLVARAAEAYRELEAERARPTVAVAGATAERPIAYFCAEYALHRSLPIYSGGLGALAGDYLKEASDRAAPMVAVGLLYRRGYFRQRLDTSGWQHEYWVEESPEHLPIVPVNGADGAPLVVRVRVRGNDVAVRVWRASVGRVPLYLLDTDVEENGPIERFITAQLYVGEREMRLLQYAVLGVGGARALAALGIEPAIVHLNEGHAAFAALELARAEVARGASFDEALARVKSRVVFTTHTPVAAGNETYAPEEILRLLDDMPAALGVGAERIAALGASQGGSRERAAFGMTELALRTSRTANGVSKRHGEVARAMWRPLWPDRSSDDAVPIGYVTNGVHARTWTAAPMRALLARYPSIDAIPDEELWAVRGELRAALVEFVRRRSVTDRLVRGEPLSYVDAAARTFDPGVLTLGFARRVAAYKRLHLLIRDVPRALGLLRGDRHVQVVIAGKAHPKDDGAKRLVQAIFTLKDQTGVGAHVAFVEDYDLEVAARLVAGCDVWVNLPRPPLEASGTSGMKAAMNGGLNLSVLDGWWCEAFDGTNGWAIDSGGAPSEDAQDDRDAARLYDLLEREVVPLFHDRDAGGVPRKWVARVRASLRTNAHRFSTARMFDDYAARVYPRQV